MPISIEIQDDFITVEERTKLANLFNMSGDHDFNRALNKMALAAIDEYIEMFIGSGLPTKVDEIRQDRLYYLVKHFFPGRIPNELEVSTLFQIPEAKAKSLILNILARFRYDLATEIHVTLSQVVQHAEYNEDLEQYRVYIDSENIVAEIDRIIANSGSRYKHLSRIRNERNIYILAPDSYELLRVQFNIPITDRH